VVKARLNPSRAKRNLGSTFGTGNPGKRSYLFLIILWSS